MIKNLGLIKAIFVGTIAPSNVNVLWHDTLNNCHKYYDSINLTWQILGQPPRYSNDTLANTAGVIFYYNTTSNKFRGKENVTWVNFV